MKRKMIAALLAACMTLSMVGCGSTAGTTETGNAESAATTDGAKQEVSSNVEDWPTVTIGVLPVAEVTDEAMVEGALNDYLASINAGVQADIILIDFGNLSTTMTLMLTSPDDPLDLFSYNFFSTLSGVVNNEQAIPLDDYMAQYPELKDVIGEVPLKTQQVNGVQYALPAITSYCMESYYALRKDIAEEIGVADLDGTRVTLDELTDILVKAKAAHSDMCFIPLTDIPMIMGIDYLGSTDIIGALMDCGLDSTEIVDYYETDAFKEYLGYVKKWEEEGLLLDDPLNQERSKSHLSTGVAGGLFTQGMNEDAIYTEFNSYGYDCIALQVSDLVATTSSFGSGWCISTVCQEPDAAMKMLDLMYTDENVMRYIAQGIEDVHYVVKDNGCSYYPEGKGQVDVGWATGAQWYFPNQTLCIPFETDNADYYKEMLEVNKTGQYSKAIGFTFDNSNVYDQYTAVSSAIAEYRDALTYGQVDIDTYLPKFIEELKAAGIDEVIAEEQEQLDAYLANQ